MRVGIMLLPHGREQAIRIGQERLGCVHFCYYSVAKYHDSVTVDDGLQSVGNCQHRAVLRNE